MTGPASRGRNVALLSRAPELGSDSRTGVTIDQWPPTGQCWKRHHKNRIDFRDAPGNDVFHRDRAWKETGERQRCAKFSSGCWGSGVELAQSRGRRRGAILRLRMPSVGCLPGRGREKTDPIRAEEVAVFGLAEAISPYTHRLAEDPKLRKRLAQALHASLIAGDRVRRQTGPLGLARGLASDPVFARQAAEAVVRMGQAKQRIDRRRHRRARIVLGLVAVATVAVVIPAVGLLGRPRKARPIEEATGEPT